MYEFSMTNGFNVIKYCVKCLHVSKNVLDAHICVMIHLKRTVIWPQSLPILQGFAILISPSLCHRGLHKIVKCGM